MKTETKSVYTDKLPDVCYAISKQTGEASIVKIYRGDGTLYGIKGRQTVDDLNKAAGVTPAQQAAMIGGVKHGWNSPEANPENYYSNGDYKGGNA